MAKERGPNIEKMLKAIIATQKKDARQYLAQKAWLRFKLTFSIEPEDISIGDWGVIISADNILFRQWLLWYRIIGRCQRCGRLISLGLPFSTHLGMLNALGRQGEKVVCFLCRLASCFEWLKREYKPKLSFIDFVSNGGKYWPPCPMFNERWCKLLGKFSHTNPNDLVGRDNSNGRYKDTS